MPKKESIFEESTKIEKANIKRTKSRFAKKISSYKEGCDLLCELVYRLSEKLNEKEIEFRDIAIASLCNRIIGTSKVIYELSIRGYNYDVMILNRSLYETSIVLWYITKDNNNAEKWITGEVNLSKMKKELGLFSNQEFEKSYGELSNFVHSNMYGIATLIEPNKEMGLDCVIEPRFDSVKSGDFLPSHWMLPLAVVSYHYKELIGKDTQTKINKAILEAKKLVDPEENTKT